VDVNAEPVSRKVYLDGLRGTAALAVLLGHLSIALAVSLGPITVLYNGNFGVCVFFILSGYVLSGLAATAKLSLAAQSVRRYLRLMIPILLTSTIAWALLWIGAYQNKAAGEIVGSWWMGAWYNFEPSFTDMVWQSVYGCFVGNQPTYNSNLWTMQPELVGSFYVFLIRAISGNRYVRAALLLLWAGASLTNYFPLFAAGALLFEFEADIRQCWEKPKSARSRGPIIVALVVVAVYLGGLYDTQPGRALPRLYGWLPQFAADNAMRWHQFGALAAMLAVLLSPLLQLVFGSAPGRYLGRISFVMYLLQLPVICSYTAWVIVSMEGYGRLQVAAVAGISTVGLMFLISSLSVRLIDDSAVRLSRLAGRGFDGLFPDRPPAQDEAGVRLRSN